MTKYGTMTTSLFHDLNQVGLSKHIKFLMTDEMISGSNSPLKGGARRAGDVVLSSHFFNLARCEIASLLRRSQ